MVKTVRAAAGITETCVYTIAHSETLAAAAKAGDVKVFREGRRWATARRLLGATRRLGLRVPVVFAAAEDTTHLIYTGWLDKITLGGIGARPATTFCVSGLRPIRAKQPKKTSLVVASTGARIPASHIRPYVLCRTPAFVHESRPPALRKVKLKPIVLYSWGYWGWGNATKALVRSVDAAEAIQGRRPPIFVDIRIRRNVRAKGFTGDAFERTVRRNRYRWIRDLGNESVLTGARRTHLRNPRAAAQLLDLAIEASAGRRRLIFFCACEFPRADGKQCHRVDVTRLVYAAARKRGIDVTIQERSFGEPKRPRLEVRSTAAKRVRASA